MSSKLPLETVFLIRNNLNIILNIKKKNLIHSLFYKSLADCNNNIILIVIIQYTMT